MILVQTKLINQHTHTSYEAGDQEAPEETNSFFINDSICIANYCGIHVSWAYCLACCDDSVLSTSDSVNMPATDEKKEERREHTYLCIDPFEQL
jgi:hypothetical protein